MELVHVLNRGVDKRTIFLDDQDRFRFVHDLFEFNDLDWANTTFKNFSKSNDIECRSDRKVRKLLVDIHAFSMMPNHYHLLLSQRVENGIAKFMKKLNMGYAKYFNAKYQRSGALFQGRYKNILIKNESHFIHIPYYIHLNPLDLIDLGWRENKLKDYRKAINFLEKYRWSSFLDYIGVKNFPSITNRSFLMSFWNSPDNYKKQTIEWLKEIDITNISGVILE